MEMMTETEESDLGPSSCFRAHKCIESIDSKRLNQRLNSAPLDVSLFFFFLN